LALFRGKPVSDWAYDFAGTEVGAPFASALDEAIGDALRSDFVEAEKEFLRITSSGRDELTFLASMGSCAWRREVISAAGTTILSLSPGLIKSAVSYEPTLKPVTLMRTARQLLQGPGLELLYEQFEVVQSLTPEGVRDLMVPATLWMSYLAQMSLQLSKPE